ncbi:pyridoxal-phosphate dependent enzyme [uncultured Cohaesibacter sp.]|uniref:pyridoxal-phosphate dependent enzyme n=1 Tax=uncultured Cohaesibacter sp. TaxID=1002546 RepID=UPI0029C7C389|nr:pyridoxal-phosphate dependent enzyme [uncultured Cohaesibacter sp.]
MSADAKKWKIERLRRFGVKVMKYEGDYNLAVAAARDAASRDPLAYFVDDEDSELLFRGYSAAAAELATQLDEAGITIGPDRPLFLYLPCGNRWRARWHCLWCPCCLWPPCPLLLCRTGPVGFRAHPDDCTARTILLPCTTWALATKPKRTAWRSPPCPPSSHVA